MASRTCLLVLLTTCLPLSFWALPAQAAECNGVQFPDTVEVGDDTLVLNGMGLRKATMFAVKVYVSALYLPERSGNAEKILAADGAWRQVLHFVRDVDGSDIRDAYDEGFEKSTGDNLGAMQQRVNALKAAIPDLKEGQVLSYSYQPGQGTLIKVDDKSSTIEGADFAEALLTISIGPEPPNEDLKSGLLGGPCE